MADTRDGYIPFEIPSIDQSCSTYYKIIGDLSSSVAPVVMLHGGPGGGHEYLLTFASLWTKYGMPVVLYDQIGCGRSTHLRDTAGDGSFWNEKLFIAELDNLLDYLHLRNGPGFHLYGHSWGAMLGAAFASTTPLGLRRLVLGSPLASHETCVEGVRMLRAQLSLDARSILDKAEENGDWDSPGVKEVTTMMGSKHVCRASSMPLELAEAWKTLLADTTVYRTM